VADVGGLDVSPPDRLPDDCRGKVARRDAGEPAPITADGGPYGGHHEDFGQVIHWVPLIRPGRFNGPDLSGDIGGLVRLAGSLAAVTDGGPVAARRPRRPARLS
jgi:hypothetical protein